MLSKYQWYRFQMESCSSDLFVDNQRRTRTTSLTIPITSQLQPITYSRGMMTVGGLAGPTESDTPVDLINHSPQSNELL